MQKRALGWIVLIIGIATLGGLPRIAPQVVAKADMSAALANSTSSQSKTVADQSNSLRSEVSDSSGGLTANENSISISNFSNETDTTGQATTTNGTVTVTLDDGELSLSSGSLAQSGDWLVNWLNSVASVDNVKTININGKITVNDLSDYTHLFANLPNLTVISGLNLLDMSNVTNVNGMFLNDSSLTDVDFEQTDFSKISDFDNMFSGCIALATVNTANWQTDSAEKMAYMFDNCLTLTAVDVTGWDTSKVTDMGYLFADCSALRTITGIDTWSVENVIYLHYMFYKDEAVTSLDIGSWDTSKVTTIKCIFNYCESMKSVNVAKWDTSRVTDMSYAFSDCPVLTGVDVSNWNTSNVTNLSYMFLRNRAATNLDVGSWDTRRVTTIKGVFDVCQSITDVAVSNWDTSQMTDISLAFANCTKLATLNVSDWDTSQVKDMQSTFDALTSLKKLDVGNWDTSSVTNINYTFQKSALVTLDLSNWDTSNVTAYTSTFAKDSKLQHLTLGGKFSFHQSTDMALPTPSTTSPYTGKWQLGSNGDTYTADTLMTTYDGSTMAGTYNWEMDNTKESVVTVKYVDTNGNPIANDTVMTGIVGDTYIAAPKTITGYQLTATPDNANGTYTADDITVTYVYKGQLIFKSVPNNIDFGSPILTGVSESYAASLDDSLTVEDYRESGGTWTLSAELTEPFVATDGQTLGATLYYVENDQETNIGSSSAQVATGSTTQTPSSINISSRWSATDGLFLRVNSSALAGTYTGTMTWILSDAVSG
ncbi:BspA family leucine-rich repeat surface protein [Levilactobacillus brevis]|uniref:BspA family leucine-rich repeat surface protein n=1 Tax=Levilactobacillus brevis TaxID=1580 RepID=UPI0031CF0FF5